MISNLTKLKRLLITFPITNRSFHITNYSSERRIIKQIICIERPEKKHFFFEDADFSITTIKKLIRHGEKDAEKVLTKHNDDNGKDRNTPITFTTKARTTMFGLC